MTSYLDLPAGDGLPEIVTAAIEIPQGGINKYEYDRVLRVFRLNRNLHSPLHFPGDYGFIPQTFAEDGDPADILLLGDAPPFPGCVYETRPVGLFEMLDHGTRDEKAIAYALGNARFRNLANDTDLQPHILKEVAHFVSIYKDLEGKRTEALGWKDRCATYETIQAARRRFRQAASTADGEPRKSEG